MGCGSNASPIDASPMSRPSTAVGTCSASTAAMIFRAMAGETKCQGGSYQNNVRCWSAVESVAGEPVVGSGPVEPTQGECKGGGNNPISGNNTTSELTVEKERAGRA